MYFIKSKLALYIFKVMKTIIVLKSYEIYFKNEAFHSEILSDLKINLKIIYF